MSRFSHIKRFVDEYFSLSSSLTKLTLIWSQEGSFEGQAKIEVIIHRKSHVKYDAIWLNVTFFLFHTQNFYLFIYLFI